MTTESDVPTFTVAAERDRPRAGDQGQRVRCRIDHGEHRRCVVHNDQTVGEFDLLRPPANSFTQRGVTGSCQRQAGGGDRSPVAIGIAKCLGHGVVE